MNSSSHSFQIEKTGSSKSKTHTGEMEPFLHFIDLKHFFQKYILFKKKADIRYFLHLCNAVAAIELKPVRVFFVHWKYNFFWRNYSTKLLRSRFLQIKKESKYVFIWLLLAEDLLSANKIKTKSQIADFAKKKLIKSDFYQIWLIKFYRIQVVKKRQKYIFQTMIRKYVIYFHLTIMRFAARKMKQNKWKKMRRRLKMPPLLEIDWIILSIDLLHANHISECKFEKQRLEKRKTFWKLVQMSRKKRLMRIHDRFAAIRKKANYFSKWKKILHIRMQTRKTISHEINIDLNGLFYQLYNQSATKIQKFYRYITFYEKLEGIYDIESIIGFNDLKMNVKHIHIMPPLNLLFVRKEKGFLEKIRSDSEIKKITSFQQLNQYVYFNSIYNFCKRPIIEPKNLLKANVKPNFKPIGVQTKRLVNKLKEYNFNNRKQKIKKLLRKFNTNFVNIRLPFRFCDLFLHNKLSVQGFEIMYDPVMYQGLDDEINIAFEDFNYKRLVRVNLIQFMKNNITKNILFLNYFRFVPYHLSLHQKRKICELINPLLHSVLYENFYCVFNADFKNCIINHEKKTVKRFCDESQIDANEIYQRNKLIEMSDNLSKQHSHLNHHHRHNMIFSNKEKRLKKSSKTENRIKRKHHRHEESGIESDIRYGKLSNESIISGWSKI